MSNKIRATDCAETCVCVVGMSRDVSKGIVNDCVLKNPSAEVSLLLGKTMVPLLNQTKQMPTKDQELIF